MDILSSRDFTCLFESITSKNGDQIINKNVICKIKNSKKMSFNNENDQNSECGGCPAKTKVNF